jgi:predicted transposase/invertase (TIGR01784 family)
MKIVLLVEKQGLRFAIIKPIKLELATTIAKPKQQKRNLDAVKHKGIMNFTKYYMNFENREMMAKFEQEVELLTGRTTPMGVKEILMDRAKNEGIEKGRAEGRHEEALEIARKLKIEGLSIEFIAKTTSLTIEEIEAL